ncbi:VOC family protein [Paraneptunicella aestuarii]|uniref:VOC family protein n=1 Tax=Paraneptunicella aestuarii TaxID=2831148 RepID=UPI001E3651DF|nr:VOC family protein [Paraneptunicella aestuarii]UAA37166.1 VOC family protein [Paraneptunicella aestuarii]
MKMNYFVVGTNDMDAATQFYDSLFANIGINQVLATDRMVYWQNEHFTFAIAIPFDKQPATNGNGTMVGFDVGSAENVKKLYNAVIELGGTCEGEPKERGPVFSAYTRDLDKNKISFYTR